MYLRGGPDTERELHFCHYPDSSSCGGESDQHRRMKAIAANHARDKYPDATIEIEATTSGVEKTRQADVLVRLCEASPSLGQGLAIECQYKHEEKDLDATARDHALAGYTTLYLDEDDFSGTSVNFAYGDQRRIKDYWPPDSQHWFRPNPVERGIDTPATSDVFEYPLYEYGDRSATIFPQWYESELRSIWDAFLPEHVPDPDQWGVDPDVLDDLSWTDHAQSYYEKGPSPCEPSGGIGIPIDRDGAFDFLSSVHSASVTIPPEKYRQQIYKSWFKGLISAEPNEDDDLRRCSDCGVTLPIVPDVGTPKHKSWYKTNCPDCAELTEKDRATSNAVMSNRAVTEWTDSRVKKHGLEMPCGQDKCGGNKKPAYDTDSPYNYGWLCESCGFHHGRPSKYPSGDGGY